MQRGVRSHVMVQAAGALSLHGRACSMLSTSVGDDNTGVTSFDCTVRKTIAFLQKISLSSSSGEEQANDTIFA